MGAHSGAKGAWRHCRAANVRLLAYPTLACLATFCACGEVSSWVSWPVHAAPASACVCREEFLQSELRKAFEDEVGDDAQLKKSSELDTAEERVPEHLNTQAIADVSVPGFNTGVLMTGRASSADSVRTILFEYCWCSEQGALLQHARCSSCTTQHRRLTRASRSAVCAALREGQVKVQCTRVIGMQPSRSSS